MSAIACAAPTVNVCHQPTFRAIRASSSSVGLGRAPPQRLGAEEDHAVEREEDARVLRRGEELPQPVLQQQAEDPGRDRGDDDQPAELRIGVVGADLAVAERASDPFDDPHPVAPEEPEEHERRREMGRDEEAQEVLLVLVDVPAEEAREDDAVPEARDGEELRDALEQPEDRAPGSS